ncbi:MAG: lactonase family protein [Phycisphaerales bacterium]|nr:beta-propeller fold lactonase family protein [Planctomycetota bacterium]MCH8509355.1 lactonase family protein [Phycisphaerales bacterium]
MQRTSRFTVAVIAAAGSLACAQATDPHIFVANNGNLEGSVSSMRVNSDGTLTLTDRVVTGTRPAISNPCPSCNAYAIDLSPNGRFLATNHASGNAGENINVYSVDEDGMLEVAHTLFLPGGGGLDIAWIRDDLLAVIITSLSSGNQIRLYAWDDAATTLSLVSSVPAGSFLTSVAVHPNRQWIFGNDSFANTVRRFTITDNTIVQSDAMLMPVSGVALGISPDGRFLYAAGGISAGGNAFVGYGVDQDTGDLTPMPGIPFTSPGSSPKGFAFSPDGQYLYVSHGTDATIRSFSLDIESGVPTTLPFMFDVGLQGTLQGMATLDGLLFALDNSPAIDGLVGAYSFTINPDTGNFTPTPGSPVPTGGISPNDVVAWPGAGCPADLNNDGVLNFFDLATYLDLFNAGDPVADWNGDGLLNFFDLAAYLDDFNAGCP